jgi:hypothetical protein
MQIVLEAHRPPQALHSPLSTLHSPLSTLIVLTRKAPVHTVVP